MCDLHKKGIAQCPTDKSMELPGDDVSGVRGDHRRPCQGAPGVSRQPALHRIAGTAHPLLYRRRIQPSHLLSHGRGRTIYRVTIVLKYVSPKSRTDIGSTLFYA